jgi:adenine specific DNA methylase Mod
MREAFPFFHCKRQLVELRRVLKPTGSLYLHCDPTAMHYLKVVLDSVFDVENYRDQIVKKWTAGQQADCSGSEDSKALGRRKATF